MTKLGFSCIDSWGPLDGQLLELVSVSNPPVPSLLTDHNSSMSRFCGSAPPRPLHETVPLTWLCPQIQLWRFPALAKPIFSLTRTFPSQRQANLNHVDRNPSEIFVRETHEVLGGFRPDVVKIGLGRCDSMIRARLTYLMASTLLYVGWPSLTTLPQVNGTGSYPQPNPWLASCVFGYVAHCV